MKKHIFVPYRINPFGAYLDCQNGAVIGMPINKGIHVYYEQDTKFIFSSNDFKEKSKWDLTNVPKGKQNTWLDYVRGCVLELNKKYGLKHGINALFDGELPCSGLSSSAALVLCCLKALADINNIKLSNEELITLERTIEHYYAGVKCGLMDPATEVLGEQDKLLYFDCLTKEYRLVPTTNKVEKLICFSGNTHSLAQSNFNSIVSLYNGSARLVADRARIKPEKYDLRHIPNDIFVDFGDILTAKAQKYWLYYYAEFARAHYILQYWRKGDLVNFGSELNASTDQFIDCFEIKDPEVIDLYNIMKNTPGVYGAKLAGSGIKGSIFAFINPDKREKIMSTITKKYLKKYPHLKDTFICSIV